MSSMLILIPLPGQEDIEALEQSIRLYASRLPKDRSGVRIQIPLRTIGLYTFLQVTICPMYAALPPARQSIIFSPAVPNTRKCILATNIAETSITIPGIKYVIDTGKCKEKRYLARNNAAGISRFYTAESESDAIFF
jgi:HrpA-like RNA helicase